MSRPGQPASPGATPVTKPTGVTRNTRGIDYQSVPRPVAGLAEEYPPSHVVAWHSHVRAQLIYASAGIMSVMTHSGSFVVPPQRAVWIPGGVEHEVHCRGRVSLRTVYVDPGARTTLPQTCRVLEVSNLFRELIIEATHLPIEYEVDGRDGHVMQLLLDEITATPTAPLHIPMPGSERLARVCRTILKEPAQNDALEDLARSIGMGQRTFTRAFRRETGMSFGAWRQHVRLLEALSRLSAGQSVTTVALDVGYSSPSAFTAMFRRTFGAAPTEYFAEPPVA